MKIKVGYRLLSLFDGLDDRRRGTTDGVLNRDNSPGLGVATNLARCCHNNITSCSRAVAREIGRASVKEAIRAAGNLDPGCRLEYLHSGRQQHRVWKL